MSCDQRKHESALPVCSKMCVPRYDWHKMVVLFKLQTLSKPIIDISVNY